MTSDNKLPNVTMEDFLLTSAGKLLQSKSFEDLIYYGAIQPETSRQTKEAMTAFMMAHHE